MEHLDFVIFIVWFPVSMELCNYLVAKKRNINNQEIIEDSNVMGIILLIAWVTVSINLY